MHLDPAIFKRLQSAAKKPTILNVQDCAAILRAFNEQAARIAELEAQLAKESTYHSVVPRTQTADEYNNEPSTIHYYLGDKKEYV